jgi:hypothetical protein
VLAFPAQPIPSTSTEGAGDHDDNASVVDARVVVVLGGASGGGQQTYRGGGSVGVVPPCRRVGKALGSLAECPNRSQNRAKALVKRWTLFSSQAAYVGLPRRFLRHGNGTPHSSIR